MASHLRRAATGGRCRLAGWSCLLPAILRPWVHCVGLQICRRSRSNGLHADPYGCQPGPLADGRSAAGKRRVACGARRHKVWCSDAGHQAFAHRAYFKSSWLLICMVRLANADHHRLGALNPCWMMCCIRFARRCGVTAFCGRTSRCQHGGSQIRHHCTLRRRGGARPWSDACCSPLCARQPISIPVLDSLAS